MKPPSLDLNGVSQRPAQGTQTNFDLVGFYTAHRRQLEALSNIVIGQLAPHSTAEVDCESLFSQAGVLAQPNCANVKIETFEP